MSVVAAAQGFGVVSRIDATISAVGDPQDGYVEVVLDGPFSATHGGSRRCSWDAWATLVHQVDNYYVGVPGVSYTPSGILDVHIYTWSGGVSQPGNLKVRATILLPPRSRRDCTQRSLKIDKTSCGVVGIGATVADTGGP